MALGDSQAPGIPFGAEDLAWMQGTLNQIDQVNAAHRSTYNAARYNPLNYTLETQRDAMNRLGMLLDQDEKIARQLRDTQESVIFSMDPAKYASWMQLAGTVTSSGSRRIFNEQLNYASLAETVQQVGGETISDITSPSKYPWWVWAIGGLVTLSILSPYVGLMKKRS
jgi:hypothetical protein